MIKEAIIKLVDRKDLTEAETEQSFVEIMSGSAEPAQIAAFITALRLKGETVVEITAAAKVMRRFATTIDVRASHDEGREQIGQEAILDTCGTGGSGINTFNISTTTAFVVAGCGVKVAKHGNRAASSACGSADVLEKLGVNINLSTADVERCIKQVGIGFIFAPLFHSAMKYAQPVRKAIAIRTIFNILGPLSNPANLTAQVLGVYAKGLTAVMAQVLVNLGISRAFVVHGLDGLDEISICAPTQISELNNSRVRTYKVRPGDFGFKKAKMDDLKGGTAEDNANIVLFVLEGTKGPCRDVVLLNAAYALVAAEKARTVKDGINIAANSIDSQAAMNKLNELKAFTVSKAY